MVLAACGGGGTSGKSSEAPSSGAGTSSGGMLTAVPSAAGPYVRNFNPLVVGSGQADGFSLRLIYEPLFQQNVVSGKYLPWLATSYKWNSTGTSITLDIRSGVKWSDGTPFGPSDVAFTFNLLKANPGLDSLPLAGATVSGSTVIVSFTRPAFSEQPTILATTPVPEHLWSNVKDPVTYTDPNPVGTGPYILSQFSPESITLVKNPHYWQPGLPHLQTIRYLSTDSTNSALALMLSGQAQLGNQGMGSALSSFVERDPAHNHVLHNPGLPIPMLVNTAHYPLSLTVLRQAISDALNRQAISAAIDNADTAALSPTLLSTLTESKYIAPQYEHSQFPDNPAEAKSMLLGAGFKSGPGGMLIDPKGKPVDLQFVVPNYAADTQAAQVVKSQLAKAGIGITVDSEAPGTWISNSKLGNFDLTEQYWSNGNFDPYSVYQPMFDFSGSAPLGQPATTDYGRFNSKTAEADLKTLEGSQTGSKAWTKAVYGLEKIEVTEVPVIPYLFIDQTATYNDTNIVGWPTKSNDYTQPGLNFANAELSVLYLKARS
jgi:peptide/nickel transport system substrate-binding protein